MSQFGHSPPPPHEQGRGLVPSNAGMPMVRDGYLQQNPYGAAPAGATSSIADTFYEYLRIIKKRRLLILAIASAIFALGTLRTMMETRIYTSSIRIQIDRQETKVVESGIVMPADGADVDFMRTQYELLMGRAMAERVAARLRLRDDPEIAAPAGRGFSLASLKNLFTRSEGAKADAPANDARSIAARDRAAAEIVFRNRTVRPVAGSRLVDVSFSDPSPARAQRIAAAYGEAFIASTIDKRFEANSYAKTFLEDQVGQLKLKIEESEKALLDFADKEQIVVATEKSSIAENNLAAANAALGALVSERIRNEQIWKQVDQSTGITLPQLLTNNVIDTLRARRNVLVTEYQEKLETFKPEYPAMVQLKNKINEVDRQLATEVKTLRAAFKSAYESSLQQENEVKARIETLRSELLDLQKRSIQYNILKRDVDTNRSLYEGLLQRFKQVDVAGGVGANNVFVVDKAELPNTPTSPNVTRSLLLAISFGLGLGLGAAFLLEQLDDTVRSPEDLDRVTGMAMLGAIPLLAPDKSMDTELQAAHSVFAESYRSLCTALQFSTEQGLPRTLLFTSAGPTEGKSTSALIVARYYALMGLKVLLIDADLRKPSLHTKTGIDNSIGLTNCLTGACAPPQAIQAANTPNLSYMPSGPLPPNAAELLGGARLHSLLTVGQEVYNLIVVDGPPVMGLADAPQLASATQATVFIAAAGTARAGGIRAAIKRLQFARAGLVGTVLTKFEPRRAGYGYGYGSEYGGYGYGYGYGYGHEYGKTADAPRLQNGDAGPGGGAGR